MTKKGIIVILALAFMCQITISQENASIEKRWEDRIKKYPIANNNIELQLTSTFPKDEKEIFLFGAVSLAHDSNWNIYVADRRSHAIVVFNSKGEYLLSFGQKGQGPGDLSYPQNIFIWRDNICVYEAGNNRIQFFDLNGTSEKSIKIPKQYLDVIISKKGIIYGIPRFVFPGTKHKMIDAIDLDGKVINSFGEPRELLMKVEIGNWSKLSLINDETEILLAYTFMPIVERYSIDGELVSKATIKSPIIDDDANLNRSHISKGELGIRRILPAIRTYKNKTYLLHTWPRVKFMELNEEYSIEHSYWTIVNWNFHVVDFLVKRDEEQTTFFCIPSGSYEQMKIHVFEVK